MNASSLTSENVTSDNIPLKANRQAKSSSPEHQTDKWSLATESRQVSSLAFLPILGIIIFVVCSFLKVYKWSRDDARWKARGDVEFGDEADVNYGIISVGDKDFCPIDIRSDGASVYDTVNSIRFLSNGYANQFSDAYTYHDTVTSYKSLLMQKAEGGQYDSIKSYKAFLQKVTQNKDLAVEVRLLENYPTHSNSADLGAAPDENNSRRSGISTTRMQGTLKDCVDKDGQVHQVGRKKSKRRKTIAEGPTLMRKTSVSNPRSRRVTSPTCSLPSVRQTFSLSGDPEDRTHGSCKMVRKKSAKNNKMIPHSTSVGKISRTPDYSIHSTPAGQSHRGSQKRRRHFSADSVRRLKRATGAMVKNSRHIEHEAIEKYTVHSATEFKKRAKSKCPTNDRMDESSSDNPNSLHSSDTDIPSDVLTSESEHDIKKSLLLSPASDNQTLDNGFIMSFHSVGDLPFPSRFLPTPPQRPSSETKLLLANARADFFKNKLNNVFSLMSPDLTVTCPSSTFLANQYSRDFLRSKVAPVDFVQISDLENHSSSAGESPDLGTDPSPSESLHLMGTSIVSTNIEQAPDVVMADALEIIEREVRPSQNVSCPLKVQQFCITLVSAQAAPLNSDC